MEISFILNDVIVNLFKNEECHRYEPLVRVNLYQPRMLLLSKESSDLLQVSS